MHNRGTLVASHGTATLNNSGSSQIKSLDEVLESCLAEVVLLKTDTDGFDANVILSGMNDKIVQANPILGGRKRRPAFIRAHV